MPEEVFTTRLPAPKSVTMCKFAARLRFGRNGTPPGPSAFATDHVLRRRKSSPRASLRTRGTPASSAPPTVLPLATRNRAMGACSQNSLAQSTVPVVAPASTINHRKGRSPLRNGAPPQPSPRRRISTYVLDDTRDGACPAASRFPFAASSPAAASASPSAPPRRFPRQGTSPHFLRARARASPSPSAGRARSGRPKPDSCHAPSREPPLSTYRQL